VAECHTVQQVLTTGQSARQGWTGKPTSIHKPSISQNACLSWSAPFEGFSNPFHIIELSKRAVMFIIIQQDKKAM
ncbi:MAG: hypothetical protein WBV84_12050, partial [Nitrososphaeraceae archaeon]